MIVPMKRASIVCLKEDKENLLKAFQKNSHIMIISPKDSKETKSDIDFSNDFKKATSIIKQIKSFEKNKGVLPQRPITTSDDILSIDNNLLELEDNFSDNLLRVNNVKTVINDTHVAMDRLVPWLKLNTPVDKLTSSKYSYITTGFISNKMSLEFKQKLEEVSAKVEFMDIYKLLTPAVIVCYIDDKEKVDDILKKYDFTESNINIDKGLVIDEYKRLKKQDEYLSNQLKSEQDKLRQLSKQSDELRLLSDQLKARDEREAVPYLETDRTVFFEGWVRSDEVDALKQAAEKATIACDIEFSEPKEDDTPPTATKNNKFVQQFEVITDMFSAPSYSESDPNPVMAPWYWIIFGMMVGDAGYGFIMLVLGLLFKKFFKPRGATKQIANILLLSSFSTMFWGVMFGGYFGVTWNPILFSPLDTPVSLLIFSLALGVLHIFSGMIIKAYENIKSGHALDAIFDQFSWMTLIVGLCMLFLSATRTIGAIMAIVAAGIILFTGGRKKPNALGKVTGGLGSLYGITSYLSDILSYSRILALGLATGVVAMVMNILGGMMGTSIIGIFFAVLIYIVGHLFNLVLSLLSAYVHDSRLQYIEFFNKFYDGGGEAFTPLSIKTNYTDIENK